MVGRAHKPTALASTPGLPPQPQVTFSDDNSRVTAVLPTGESLEVLLYGATVISWKDGAGDEKLWLSDAAKLDGTKAVRGGIPLVFPVFGTAPDHAQTSKLPQHGFARTSRWEFLGKSTSESESAGGAKAAASSSSSKATAAAADQSVKLDFGLSSANLDDKTRALWPFAFSLIYGVTLNRDSLTTSLVVTNDDDKPFDCQVLLHTYLRVEDISNVSITGLDGASYVDKVDGAKTKTQSSGAVQITGETDRVYTPAAAPSAPVVVVEGGRAGFSVTRDSLGDVVVWNPWADKAAAMADFAPADGFRRMVCVEAGSVADFQTLEPGDAFEGAQTIAIGSRAAAA
ncbi:aldose-1-epimerase [Lasiosphaeria miniovina]|uniref:Glucose-6-phosphate 1-epimerase n=1 Tax=Lasiosphaeria miniovina TaxID=1954250 RepID=A0AA40BHH8_9PEZI|nr:aldose-1-epimerase [Lasiosphaeria miniovina]KAK0734321.1 aldose-1-epimerase [Lasiosphaeria miniovina]